MVYISQIQKFSAKREAKKVSGINYEEIKNKMISEGLNPTPDDIKAKLLDENNLVIPNSKKDLINIIDLDSKVKKRINELESAVILIGAALNNQESIKETLDLFNWYLETFELAPGMLNLKNEDIKDVSSINSAYLSLYNKISEEKRKSKKEEEKNKEISYLSDDVVYRFKDGWKVVYIPAAGEIEEYPGIDNSSYDRILEGNKNGLCLGSYLRYYQTNEDGLVYSLRDPSNKPMVTMMIKDHELVEAKAKYNTVPKLEYAIKAVEWFKNYKINGVNLSYEDNEDYKKFPPTELEGAEMLFSYRESADEEAEINGYDDEFATSYSWVSEWYGKGSEEIDSAVDEMFENKDHRLIQYGFIDNPIYRKKMFPVIKNLCNQIINGELEDHHFQAYIIYDQFGNLLDLYKNIPEMKNLVSYLIDHRLTWSRMFFQNNLFKIDQYKEFTEKASLKLAESLPSSFISLLNENKIPKEYIPSGISKLIDTLDRLENLEYRIEVLHDLFTHASDKLSAENIHTAINKYVKAKEESRNRSTEKTEKPWYESRIHPKGSFLFIPNIEKNNWLKEYFHLFADDAIKQDAISFCERYLYIEWVDIKYIEKAFDSSLEKYPQSLVSFISEGIEKEKIKDDGVNLKIRDLDITQFLKSALILTSLNSIETYAFNPIISRFFNKDMISYFIHYKPGVITLLYKNKENCEWMKPYIEHDIKRWLSVSSYGFLEKMETIMKPPFNGSYEGIDIREYYDSAIKKSLSDYVDKDKTIKFLERNSGEEWAKPYLQMIEKNSASNDLSENIIKKLAKLKKELSKMGIHKDFNF